VVVHWHCSQSSRNVPTERERERGGGQIKRKREHDRGGEGVHRVSIKENATEEEAKRGIEQEGSLAAIPGIRFGIFLCISRIVEIVPQAGH